MHTHTAPSMPIAIALRRVLARWRALRDAWADGAVARRRRRVDRHHLQAMSAHELSDLGIGRAEVDYWLGEPRH